MHQFQIFPENFARRRLGDDVNKFDSSFKLLVLGQDGPDMRLNVKMKVMKLFSSHIFYIWSEGHMAILVINGHMAIFPSKNLNLWSKIEFWEIPQCISHEYQKSARKR